MRHVFMFVRVFRHPSLHVILIFIIILCDLSGIVRMEAIDDFPFPIDGPRETGDNDHCNPELIPLLRNSYLGWFEFWSYW